MNNFKDLKFMNFDYNDWLSHFKENARKDLVLDFTREPSLPDEEAALIFPSISYFQAGEKSDGVHLKKCAYAFSKRINCSKFISIIRCFITEENMHSSYLKSFMYHHCKPAKERIFLDSAFRHIRRLFGFKTEVIVLVTAEIVALSYYSALKNATSSSNLKAICNRMLQDETAHIVFQAYNLSHFKTDWVIKTTREILMLLTSLSLWICSNKLFKAGGYNLLKFLKSNFKYLNDMQELQKIFAKKHKLI